MLNVGGLIEEGNPFILLAMVSLLAVVIITVERFYTLYSRYRLKVPPFR